MCKKKIPSYPNPSHMYHYLLQVWNQSYLEVGNPSQWKSSNSKKKEIELWHHLPFYTVKDYFNSWKTQRKESVLPVWIHDNKIYHLEATFLFGRRVSLPHRSIMLVLIFCTQLLQAGINGVGLFTGYDPYCFGLVVASSAGSMRKVGHMALMMCW